MRTEYEFFHCVIKMFYYTAFKRPMMNLLRLVGNERAALTPEKRQGQ